MVFTIKERQQFGSPNFINLLNLFLRFCQIVLCAAVIGIYAVRVRDEDFFRQKGSFVLAEACGAISLIIALIFAVIPFLISYYYVAVFFAFEMVLTFIWISVYVKQQQIFGNEDQNDVAKNHGVNGIDTMIATQWIDLTCLLLFLTTTLMGIVCLYLDWRGQVHANRAGA